MADEKNTNETEGTSQPGGEITEGTPILSGQQILTVEGDGVAAQTPSAIGGEQPDPNQDVSLGKEEVDKSSKEKKSRATKEPKATKAPKVVESEADKDGFAPLKFYPGNVYPSDKVTVSVKTDDIYGGAHEYKFKECLGFADGKTSYADSEQTIRFVKKEGDTMLPGLQSEQLIIALIDRHEKLNSKFPDHRHHRLLAALKSFLQASKERVDERIERGVMGKLIK